MKKTKILCTIGPASLSTKMLKKMIKAGMNAARINLSHGTFEQYEEIIKNIRSVKDIPIIIDTQGPEVRIHTHSEICIRKNQTINIGLTKKDPIYVDYNFFDQIKKDDPILIEDGLLSAKIISKTKRTITVKFNNNGILKNRKGVTLPNSELDMPILTKKDKEGVRFAIKHDLDFIALSFTRSAKDIKTVKKMLKNANIGIISKIENKQGLDNFDDILEASDGIMVARGDLGVQLPSESLPLIQKELIRKCNINGKFVITATQMLQSMVDNPTPTRAETSDVANAILDGTDTVMLSAESAVGKYPIKAVEELSRIAGSVEFYAKANNPEEVRLDVADAISHSVHDLTSHIPFNKIVVLTYSGYTAKMISRYRLREDIIATTPNKKVKKKIELYFGINPVIYKNFPKKDRIYHSAAFLYEKKLLNKDDLVLFTAGIYAIRKRTTNLIQIHTISDLLEYGKTVKPSSDCR